MNELTDTDLRSGGRQTKVARLIEEFDLEPIGDEMEQRWTSDGDDRMSLRKLADYFNVCLLKRALARSTRNPFPSEPETIYRLLTDESQSTGDRLGCQRRLERAGVDVDALLDNFVSYQAIRSYLQKEREVQHQPNQRDRIQVESENIQRLRGRVVSVTGDKLDSLSEAGHIVLGDFRVIADIQIFCEECGTQSHANDVLKSGGCACQDTPSHPDKN